MMFWLKMATVMATGGYALIWPGWKRLGEEVTDAD
jgi:hypothetical protein